MEVAFSDGTLRIPITKRHLFLLLIYNTNGIQLICIGIVQFPILIIFFSLILFFHTFHFLLCCKRFSIMISLNTIFFYIYNFFKDQNFPGYVFVRRRYVCLRLETVKGEMWILPLCSSSSALYVT